MPRLAKHSSKLSSSAGKIKRINPGSQEPVSCPVEAYRLDAKSQARLRASISKLRDTARELAQQDAGEIVERFGQMGRRKFNLAA